MAIPDVPTGLTAAAGSTYVQLAWLNAAGAASYNVYQSTVNGDTGLVPLATGVAGLSYLSSGLTDGTTYYFQVTGMNNDGESAKSLQVSATPTSAPGDDGGMTFAFAERW